MSPRTRSRTDSRLVTIVALFEDDAHEFILLIVLSTSSSTSDVDDVDADLLLEEVAPDEDEVVGNISSIGADTRAGKFVYKFSTSTSQVCNQVQSFSFLKMLAADKKAFLLLSGPGAVADVAVALEVAPQYVAQLEDGELAEVEAVLAVLAGDEAADEILVFLFVFLEGEVVDDELNIVEVFF